ncbi:MAG: AMP-binding protein [Marinilabiliales bacterium]|nr:AMP-binding protein [Marinilabiliales bacterium]
MLNEKLVGYIEGSLKKNSALTALTDYKGESYTYGEVAHQIIRFHTLFAQAGIGAGDKVALLGKNSARWCIGYLSVITWGAVVVPILPDFKPDDLHFIMNHSDATLFLCADYLFQDLDMTKVPKIRCAVSLQKNQLLYAADETALKAFQTAERNFQETYPTVASIGDFRFPEVSNDKLAVISYTSGTMGFSKGVMLSHNSLTANIRFAQAKMPLQPGDSIVSFLPLAHAYGCAFEFLFPFSIGCRIVILTKTPSPKVVIQAFQEIRPALVLSVPLVIEKIYKKQILPEISKPSVKMLLRIPGIRTLLHTKIRKKLADSFGGKFHEVVIGGAAFNNEAEKFFRQIRFPYTVGYGMTECGPLISYAPSATTKFGSAGISVDTLAVTIDSPDPVNIVGEILIKGDNVMNGYYKNEEATRQILDDDGWLHSGDMGVIDKDGFIFIRGRCKNMLLGANGKNIYPEELEAMLNNKFGIGESLVVQRDEDKLVALIYADQEVVQAHHLTKDALEGLFRQYLKEVNSSVPSYMQLSRFEIRDEEFVKTPKRSIKRFLYA